MDYNPLILGCFSSSYALCPIGSVGRMGRKEALYFTFMQNLTLFPLRLPVVFIYQLPSPIHLLIFATSSLFSSSYPNLGILLKCYKSLFNLLKNMYFEPYLIYCSNVAFSLGISDHHLETATCLPHFLFQVPFTLIF